MSTHELHVDPGTSSEHGMCMESLRKGRGARTSLLPVPLVPQEVGMVMGWNGMRMNYLIGLSCTGAWDLDLGVIWT